MMCQNPPYSLSELHVEQGARAHQGWGEIGGPRRGRQ